jgi:hypothetical protein
MGNSKFFRIFIAVLLFGVFVAGSVIFSHTSSDAGSPKEAAVDGSQLDRLFQEMGVLKVLNPGESIQFSLEDVEGRPSAAIMKEFRVDRDHEQKKYLDSHFIESRTGSAHPTGLALYSLSKANASY